MHFNYHQGYAGPVLEAYEKVLLDAMLGDQTLFWRQDGLEACWSFLDPVLAQCDSLCETGQMLHPYEAGTWGPEAARGLQHRNEETWSG
jgi:glucose-6-phosphate 1-dehydrogenase